MKAMGLDWVLETIHDAVLEKGCSRVEITGVSIDSRKVKPGDLFFAFSGEHVDGHDYIEDAFHRGAAAAVISRPVCCKRDKALIRVSDPLQALQALARGYRSLFDIPVVAVTGSTGKTTTKDLIAGVLGSKMAVIKTEGNYNNEIGLPLTLLNLDDRHQAAVLEMAMRGRGQIAELCEISRPQLGVITNIGKTHLELLGSQEAIAEAKGELLSSLPPEGCAVLNADDPWQLKMASRVRGELIYYGTDSKCQVRATDIRLRGLEGVDFKLHTPSGEADCFLPLPGRHNVANALAAAAVGYKFSLNPEEIAAGLAYVSLTGMRLDVKAGIRDTKIIDDSYNASPASTIAALELLAAVDGNRKTAVLGDMYELGEETITGHREVGVKAAVLSIDCLCTVGELAREIAVGAESAGLPKKRIHTFQEKAEAIAFLKSYLEKGDVVLIKGSRGMRMEEITASLVRGVFAGE
ncbi:MAG TPA: UDP-N-acetylmuramoyl-tripeptide--D-alanyl-D-alanine ligase [Syntrophaceticus sp.]|nr:UDP-N-acetylmuramoyl-tripeptide--D-alanyl-D-alanine ligase [Syntrophaceticus sp.]